MEDLEQIMRKIHVLFAKCEPYGDEKANRIIVPKKDLFRLLEQLNYAVMQMMDQYEATVESRDRGLAEYQRKGSRIIEEAQHGAEDIYAASLVYTDNMVYKLQDLLADTGKNLKEEYMRLSKRLDEQARVLEANQQEVKEQLQAMIQGEKYLNIIYRENLRLRRIEAAKQEELEEEEYEEYYEEDYEGEDFDEEDYESEDFNEGDYEGDDFADEDFDENDDEADAKNWEQEAGTEESAQGQNQISESGSSLTAAKRIKAENKKTAGKRAEEQSAAVRKTEGQNAAGKRANEQSAATKRIEGQNAVRGTEEQYTAATRTEEQDAAAGKTEKADAAEEKSGAKKNKVARKPVPKKRPRRVLDLEAEWEQEQNNKPIRKIGSALYEDVGQSYDPPPKKVSYEIKVNQAYFDQVESSEQLDAEYYQWMEKGGGSTEDQPEEPVQKEEKKREKKKHRLFRREKSK